MKYKDLHPNIKYRIINSFLSSTAFNMILPFMAIYFSTEFNEAIAGLLLTVNIILGIAAGFYGGYLTDIIGRRKIMLWAGGFRLFSFVVMTLANSPWYHSPTITYIAFIAISMCSGFSRPATQAMVIDVSTSDTRRFIYNIEYWSMNTALFIGSVIGSYLFKSHRFEVFFSVTMVSVLSLVIISVFIDETRHSQGESYKSHKFKIKSIYNNYKIVLKNKTFSVFIIASLLALSIEMQAKNYISVRLVKDIPSKTPVLGEYALDGIQIYGILRAENALTVIILGLFISSLVRKYGDKRLLIIGIIVNVLAYSVLTISSNVFLLFIFMLLATLGEIIYWPIKQSFLAKLIPSDNRGSYMTINGLVAQGANIMGSLAITIGAFVNSWTISAMLLILGGTSIVLFNLTICNIQKRNAAKEINIS